MRLLTQSRVIGTFATPPGTKSGLSASGLMQRALNGALQSAGVNLGELDGIIAVPSLAEPHFMEAHYLATQMGLLPHKGVIARTIDTGGAGPISGLLQADQMIRLHGCDLVAIVAGDAVSSMPTKDFLKRADAGCADPAGTLPSPVIPSGYDRVARWHIERGEVTREQLAMVSVLMSRHAVRHPHAITKTPLTLQEVLDAPSVAPATGLLECARRADGGAAVLLASSHFINSHGIDSTLAPVLLAGGEASGPLYPPPQITEEMFSCEVAAQAAYDRAQLKAADIDFFGLYDCFPVCLIRALEAVGLAERGQGGAFIERVYRQSEENGGELTPELFPVNTHGGLLSFGAPWEVPAMYNIIEAVAQLTGRAGDRQVGPGRPRRALVYGNGGIFSASALAILGEGGAVRPGR